jgi:hypothetical protein
MHALIPRLAIHEIIRVLSLFVSDNYQHVWFSFFLTSFFENLAVEESGCVKNLSIIRITCGVR